jgi:hypothetical protein
MRLVIEGSTLLFFILIFFKPLSHEN